MKKSIRVFINLLGLAGIIGFGASAAPAQIVVNVADTGTATSYVNGVGATLFVGTTAVKDAIAAINADPTVGAAFFINIKDTDGVADNYLVVNGVVVDKPNVTIQQVPNGTGNDAPVTFWRDNAPQGGAMLSFAQPNCTVQGLSADKKLIMQLDGTVARWATGGAGANALVKWVTITNDNDTGTVVSTNKTGDNQQFVECEFNGPRIGPQIGGPNPIAPLVRLVTFTRCRFAKDRFPISAAGAAAGVPIDIVADDCYFVIKENFNLIGIVSATFNNCTFEVNTATKSILGAATAVPDTAQTGTHLPPSGAITFNNPTFIGANTVELFRVLPQNNITVTINGVDAANKTLITTAGGPLANMGNGTLALNDVKLDKDIVNNYPAVNPANVPGGVPHSFIALSRVESDSTTIGLTADFSLETNITATNTIFKNCVLGTTVGGGNVTLTHCTFFGNDAGNPFITAENGAVITANYNIFNTAPAGNAIINAGTVNGAFNLVNGPGGTGSAALNLTDTMIANPLLDASGHLMIDSPAIGGAAGSLLTIDVDGELRPLGAASNPDLGADETALVPVELSTFSIE